MTPPKVTIIVPAHNASKYLARCINSLVNQTLKNTEILVMDDNSSDGSDRIIKEFQKKHHNITLIRENKNIGAGAIRNKGLNEANGKYILFVDSDDWIEANACEVLYNISEHNNLELLIGNYRNKVAEDSEVLQESLNTADIILCDGLTFLENYETNTAVWGKLWKLDFIKEHNLKNQEGRTYEDLPMVLEGIIQSKQIAKTDFAFYNYFVDNPNAITKKAATEKNLEDRLWLMDYLSKQNEYYKDNTVIVNYISKLMLQQIIPALNNLRTYSGHDTNLEHMLLKKIEYHVNKLKLKIWKTSHISLIKKALILMSPKLYLRLITFIDFTKTRTHK